MAKTFNYPDVVFVERLNELKEERKLTDAEIGRRIGTKKQTVQMWRYGVNSPNSVYFKKLAVALNISSDYLLGLSNDKTTLR